MIVNSVLKKLNNRFYTYGSHVDGNLFLKNVLTIL